MRLIGKDKYCEANNNDASRQIGDAERASISKRVFVADVLQVVVERVCGSSTEEGGLKNKGPLREQ